MEITIGGRTLSQMDSPSLARLSGGIGDVGPTTYYSYNNHMTITFNSDNANHGNFEFSINRGEGLRVDSPRASVNAKVTLLSIEWLRNSTCC